jgi:hypothetical protein
VHHSILLEFENVVAVTVCTSPLPPLPPPPLSGQLLLIYAGAFSECLLTRLCTALPLSTAPVVDVGVVVDVVIFHDLRTVDTEFSFALLNAALQSVHLFLPWASGVTWVVVHERTEHFDSVVQAMPAFKVCASASCRARVCVNRCNDTPRGQRNGGGGCVFWCVLCMCLSVPTGCVRVCAFACNACAAVSRT